MSQQLPDMGQMPPQGAPQPGALADALQIPPGTQQLSGEEPVGGMNAEFARRFGDLQAAVRQSGGDLYIFSGARDPQQQAEMFNDAVRKYGDEKEARKRVKEPGKSSHDPSYGVPLGLGQGALGADLRGDLAIAHKLGPRFGIVFPDKNSPWHAELAGLDKV